MKHFPLEGFFDIVNMCNIVFHPLCVSTLKASKLKIINKSRKRDEKKFYYEKAFPRSSHVEKVPLLFIVLQFF